MTAGRWDSLIYSAAVVLPRLPAFLLLPAIASALSLTDMGILATAWVFIELFQTFAGMGLKASLGRYFPLAQSLDQRREILSIALSGILAGGLAMGLFTWAAYAWPLTRGLIQFFQVIDIRVFSTLLLASMVGNLASAFTIYFRAERRAWAFLSASLIGALAELGLCVALLVTGRISLLNLLLVECLKQGTMLLFIAYMARRDWGLAFSAKTLRTMAGFGIWLVPVGLGEWLVGSSDRFWLGQHGDLEKVGIYGFLYKFAMPLGVLLTGSLMNLHSQLYRMPDAEGLGYTRDRLAQYLGRSGFMMLGYAILIPVAFNLAARFYPIFPAAYLGGLAAFPLMVAILYTFYWGKYYAMYLEFRYRTRALTAALTLAAAASMILIPLSIRLCRAEGFDVVTGTAYGALSAQLLSLAFLGRLAALPGGRASAARGLAFVAACMAASWIMGSRLTGL